VQLLKLVYFSPTGTTKAVVQGISRGINQFSVEIIEAKGINIDEYLDSKEIHPYNKKIVITAMQNRGIKLEVNDFFATKNTQHEFFF